MTDQENWRDKYLHALDEMEAQEREVSKNQQQWSELVNDFTFACDGFDPELDKAMDDARGQLRNNDLNLGDLTRQLRRFEQNKALHMQAQRRSFEGILTGLAAVAPERAVEIESFRGQIENRSGQWHHYRLLLERLEELIADCLGLTDSNNASQSLPSTADGSSPIGVTPKLTQRLHSLLISWVAELEPLTGRHKVLEHWRRRLEKELDWPSLLEALEDFRALALVGYSLAGENFSQYLQQVSSELKKMMSTLQEGGQAFMALDDAGEQLSQEFSSGINTLSSLMAGDSVEQLQGQVAVQIEAMQQAVIRYREASSQSRHQLLAHNQRLEEQLQASESKVSELHESLVVERQKAMTDPLTQLPNRQSYMERSEQEWLRWQRYGGQLALALVDIDHFKKINDQFGHPAGDRVLALVAKLMRQRLRQVDYLARIGGEEFVIILPETGLAQACDLMNQLRESIASAPVNFKGQPLELTVSMGVTCFIENDVIQKAYLRADKALYRAKAQGRNCVLSAEED